MQIPGDIPIDTNSVCPEHDHGAVDLILLEGIEDMSHRDLVVIRHFACTTPSVQSQAIDDELPLTLRKELRGLRRVRQDLPDEQRQQDRDESLEDENPLPATKSSDAIYDTSQRNVSQRCPLCWEWVISFHNSPICSMPCAFHISCWAPQEHKDDAIKAAVLTYARRPEKAPDNEAAA